ncbi:hypothetical protein DFQ11_10916 [Winogradskyella epiphytica]|uniref:Uncharacterized protein n=1 Tax=Winogradskyella epiphytica TaxID=262005 RepID=A0A2V4WTD3_9FLAO|nr:hypothetical protein [Winogradskyella epiphytica]PYE79631.1 hypothetical protein DFQ11_10916 [Winogradskyella epiphytica]
MKWTSEQLQKQFARVGKVFPKPQEQKINVLSATSAKANKKSLQY